MQARRPAPVAISLQPQPLQTCRSSLLSATSSPRTPCGSPKWSPIHFSSAANRNSTDSWNSSNGPDEIEWDWKPEQILLLTRTLDALPAHLVTPFIGPVPPSNLLDRIARGVAHAKGPVDWPHSIRATRVKLLELAKIRAKEESAHSRPTISYASERENRFNTSFPNVGTSPDKKQTIHRPLYRQNSMDFMNIAEPHLDEDNITGLSNRLQRTDKPSIYDSYTRKSRLQLSSGPCTTPPSKSFISPYTPSSSTLTSLTSWSTLSRSRLRRSTSTASTTSSMSITSGSSAPLSDPRLERLRSIQADIPPVPPPKDNNLPKLGSKRAPSYGALVQGAKHEKEASRPATHERRNSTTSCASSDEEEKVRAERAKKQKMKVNKTPLPPNGVIPLSPPLLPTKPSTPVLRESFAQNARSKRRNASASSNVKAIDQSELSQTIASPPAPHKKLPMNLQRNPSIFGDELPPVKPKSPMQMTQSSTTQSATPTTPAVHPNSPVYTTSPLSSAHPSPSPGERCRQTLRRVRRFAPGRRISFGGLLPIKGNDDPGDRAIDPDAESSSKKISLGSAFQMH